MDPRTSNLLTISLYLSIGIPAISMAAEPNLPPPGVNTTGLNQVQLSRVGDLAANLKSDGWFQMLVTQTGASPTECAVNFKEDIIEMIYTFRDSSSYHQRWHGDDSIYAGETTVVFKSFITVAKAKTMIGGGAANAKCSFVHSSLPPDSVEGRAGVREFHYVCPDNAPQDNFVEDAFWFRTNAEGLVISLHNKFSGC